MKNFFSRYYNISSTFPTTASTACRRRHSIGTFLEKEAGTNTTAGRQQVGGCRNWLEPSTMATPISDDIDGAPCNEGRHSCNKIKRRRHKNNSFKKGKYRSI